MPFKLIAFDWDGTLMDSEARIVACMHHAFADCDVPPPSRAETRGIIGLGLREALVALWPEGDEADRARVVERYRYHYLVADDTPTPLFPGAHQVVGTLAEAGYLLAVATGKSRRGLDAALVSSGLKRYFHATRCADETLSKPHPQMLLELMDELGTSGRETLMVGDTEYDVLMAHNARASALAVTYGVHERERLMQHGPLDCLDSVQEIPGWLERRAG